MSFHRNYPELSSPGLPGNGQIVQRHTFNANAGGSSQPTQQFMAPSVHHWNVFCNPGNYNVRMATSFASQNQPGPGPAPNPGAVQPLFGGGQQVSADMFSKEEQLRRHEQWLNKFK